MNKIREAYRSFIMYLAIWCARELGCDVEVKQNKENPDNVDWLKFIFPKEQK